jgi:hypothetical protein
MVYADPMANSVTEFNEGGGTVTLRGVKIDVNSDIGAAFVTDCVRNVEGLIGADQLRKKYELDDDGWTGLADNEPLEAARSPSATCHCICRAACYSTPKTWESRPPGV